MEALSSEMILVLVILAGAVTLFVTEVVRVDVAAVLVMVVVGLAGLVPASEVFAGFASNAVISIIAVMILGAALDRVGVMQSVARVLLRVGGSTERRIVASSSVAVGGISAFMQNIGAAALFLPVMERVAERTRTPVSRLLMPMGFAAILGGTLTLVASGPLILLNDLLASSAGNLGVPITAYGLFSPTPIGIGLLAGGIALFAIAGRWLLPDAGGTQTSTGDLPGVAERYGLDGSMRALRVDAESSLIGFDVEHIEARHPGVLLAAIHQGGSEPHLAPPRDEVITAGATVGLVGKSADLDRFALAAGLQAATDESFRRWRDPDQVGLVEAVVRPGGSAVGSTVRALRLRAHRGLTVLAIHHRGQVLTSGLREHRLAGGDVLVLSGDWARIAGLEDDPALVIISDRPPVAQRRDKLWWALGWFAVSMALVVGTDLQLSLALMVGAAGVMATGVLAPDDAYRSVSWKTVFLLAALIPLGQAVESTGTAAWIANAVISATGGLPVWANLLVIGLMTTGFTLVISNVGATVLLVPLAVNVAVGVGADPAMFGLMVAISASNAFLLPTHQVNALLMGPGGYRVADYLRAGTAMSVLVLAIATPLVLWFG